jgi:hypothetical protein
MLPTLVLELELDLVRALERYKRLDKKIEIGGEDKVLLGLSVVEGGKGESSILYIINISQDDRECTSRVQ